MSKVLKQKIARATKQKETICQKIDALEETAKEIDMQLVKYKKLLKKQEEIYQSQKQLDAEIASQVGGQNNE